jgi:hypothetical protein
MDNVSGNKCVPITIGGKEFKIYELRLSDLTELENYMISQRIKKIGMIDDLALKEKLTREALNFSIMDDTGNHSSDVNSFGFMLWLRTRDKSIKPSFIIENLNQSNIGEISAIIRDDKNDGNDEKKSSQPES